MGRGTKLFNQLKSFHSFLGFGVISPACVDFLEKSLQYLDISLSVENAIKYSALPIHLLFNNLANLSGLDGVMR